MLSASLSSFHAAFNFSFGTSSPLGLSLSISDMALQYAGYMRSHSIRWVCSPKPPNFTGNISSKSSASAFTWKWTMKSSTADISQISALPTSASSSMASSLDPALAAERSPFCQRQMNRGIVDSSNAVDVRAVPCVAPSHATRTFLPKSVISCSTDWDHLQVPSWVRASERQEIKEAVIELIQQENLPAKRRSCQISMAKALQFTLEHS